MSDDTRETTAATARCSVCGGPVAVFALKTGRFRAMQKCARCRQPRFNASRRAADRRRVERALGAKP